MAFRSFARLACLCLVAWPLGASAQPAAGGPRAPAQKSDSSGFAVVPWLSFDPVGASLIRSPSQMDLTAREDQTNITVFGHKRKPDVAPRRDDGYTPLNNAAAIPNDIPVLPSSSCSNGAYNTVAGQAATGSDLVGFLGGGRC